jgi:hypothetical protein
MYRKYDSQSNPNAANFDNEQKLPPLTSSIDNRLKSINNILETSLQTRNKMNFASGSLRAALAANNRRANKDTGTPNEQCGDANNNNVNPKETKAPDQSTSPTSPKEANAVSQVNNPNIATPNTKTATTEDKYLASKQTTAWTCTIAPRKDNARAEVTPFLKGFIKALMFVHPPAWIKTHPASTETELKITDENDVTKHADNIDHFAEDWHYIKNNKLILRLHIVTDMPMHEIANVPMFANWLKQQKIQLTISELKTARPMYAGFFKDTLAETKRLHLFKTLLEQVYKTNDLFDYQIVVRTLYLDNSRVSAQFFLVLTGSDDVNLVRQTFASSRDKIGIEFHPWNQYANLEPLQKGHILSEQKELQDLFRCAIIGGFTDSNPTMTLQPDPTTATLTPMDITMGNTADQRTSDTNTTPIPLSTLTNNRYTILETFEDEEVEDNYNNTTAASSENNNQETKLPDKTNNNDTQTSIPRQMAMYDAPEGINMDTTTVTDFIYQYYKNSYDEPMFTEVWHPVAGSIQLFYQAKRRHEVEDLLPFLRLETARFMTEESIDFAFTDSELLLADLGSDRYWQPFSLTKQIPEADPAIINPYSRQAKQNKRKRRQHQAMRNTPPQNSPYTSSINAMVTIPAEIFTAPPREQQSQTTLTNSLSQTTHQGTKPSPIPQTNQQTPTSDGSIEQRILQLCKTMVDETSQNLRHEIKTTNDAMARKIHDSKEILKSEIRAQVTTLRDETTSQLNLQRQDLETKIDATRQDTIDIKRTQTDLQTTQESILKGQNDVKALLESLTQGIKNLKPDCAPNPTSKPTDNYTADTTGTERGETITQSPTTKTSELHPTPMEDVEPSKKRSEIADNTTNTHSNKTHKTNKENIPGYNSWKALLNYGVPTQTSSERAATPSETSESRSEKRQPLAAKQQ